MSLDIQFKTEESSPARQAHQNPMQPTESHGEYYSPRIETSWSESSSDTMNESKRFVMTEDPWEAVPAVVWKAKGGRRKRFSGMCSVESLQELDDTVASVTRSYRSSSRQGEEEDSISTSSQTIATQEGHNIYTHRNLIGNMQEMTKTRHSLPKSYREGRSMRSNKSKPSRSSRASSKKSRRKRGSSLERIVSKTILLTATRGADEAHFLVTSNGKRPVDTPSADFILKDLVHTAMIEKEVSSVQTSGTAAKLRANFLHPKVSHDVRSGSPQRKRKDAPPSPKKNSEVSVAKSPETLMTDVSSEESSSLAGVKRRSPSDFATSPDKSSDDPFAQLDDHEQQSSTLFSITDDGASRDFTASPSRKFRDPPGKVCSSEQAYEQAFEEPLDSLLDSEGWTTFNSNPFASSPFSGEEGDGASDKSPSSIADFGKSKKDANKGQRAVVQAASPNNAWDDSGFISTQFSI